MRVILRLLFALSIGITALSLSDMGFVARTIGPAGTLLRIDADPLGFFGDAEARDEESSTINLGDCLRGTSTKDWPADYAAICDDLNAGMKAGELPAPAAEQGAVTTGKPPKTKPARRMGEAASPPAKPEPAQRPQKPRASALPQAAPKAAAAVPPKPEHRDARCTVDEYGAVSRTDGGDVPESGGRQVMRGRSPGVALLLPGACKLKSPVNGKVLFAGTFKGYSGVVILALDGGRHRLVIAGLGAIYVQRGELISHGKLIGESADAAAPALASAYEIEKGSLVYFDMRNRKGAAEEVSWLAGDS
ncbi:MAG TPA: hypothetical protein VF449_08435 [Parvibaculum sp.]